MKYVAIIEKTGNGYGAYTPEFPGCIAAGDTLEETEALMREAICYHIKLMREHGEHIPEPTSAAILVGA